MSKPKPIYRLERGDVAPDFTLPATGDTAGRGQPRKQITLSSFHGEKNVVLVFYPAAFTPV
jgi:peroxiredoxin